MEEYAQRLRELHRDLTLVLEAVERGLAAAAGEPERAFEPEQRTEPPPPPPRHAPDRSMPGDVRVVPHEAREHTPPGPPPSPLAREGMLGLGGARVEVIPAPTGEQGRMEGEERRAPVELPEPADPFAAAGEEPADVPGRSQRLPARPSETSAAFEAEPEWVHREPPSETFTAARFGPSAPAGGPPPMLLAALVAGWLTVLALALALLL